MKPGLTETKRLTCQPVYQGKQGHPWCEQRGVLSKQEATGSGRRRRRRLSKLPAPGKPPAAPTSWRGRSPENLRSQRQGSRSEAEWVGASSKQAIWDTGARDDSGLTGACDCSRYCAGHQLQNCALAGRLTSSRVLMWRVGAVSEAPEHAAVQVSQEQVIAQHSAREKPHRSTRSLKIAQTARQLQSPGKGTGKHTRPSAPTQNAKW